jgi:hypothetical protein
VGGVGWLKLQVANWIVGESGAAWATGSNSSAQPTVIRIKNRFAQPREQVCWRKGISVTAQLIGCCRHVMYSKNSEYQINPMILYIFHQSNDSVNDSTELIFNKHLKQTVNFWHLKMRNRKVIAVLSRQIQAFVLLVNFII